MSSYADTGLVPLVVEGDSKPRRDTWTRLLTYTLATTFLSCPRKAYWRFVRVMKPTEQVAALELGRAVHGALAAWAERRKRYGLAHAPPVPADLVPTDLDPAARPYFLAMVTAYFERWHHDGLEPTHVEDVFAIRILSRKSGKPTWWHAGGRIDRIVRVNGVYYILETKTTTTVGEAYLKRLWLDSQIRLYAYAAPRMWPGLRIAGVIYDVLLKPSLRQRKNETAEEFAQRLMERCAEPESLFRQEILLPTGFESEVEEWLWDVSQLYAYCYRTGRWPQNTAACFNHYGRRCPYHMLCASNDNPIVLKENYVEREPYEELLDPDEDPTGGAAPAAD